ncbi:dihydroorotate dehydrogenase B, electron transfer subunit [Clostridium acetireducens DSM 10703]|jgi:ferredoxin--NADP+ reductase|uniref:Dihydroorotate dehydrogenase B, electron transfer subunit n=1 Tax=Clostridium acetireducens DSM 10703 TaxID=1121290 RepID=A0A1E8EYZ6_9CLOT|nr:sulfide/dihydroorotate dehydrogenase-like FAD/NAD-binding protein [Clostridium acetireducens]OFI06218.1 dihydroorotate dehydrogenase B, electron transfer subunit [Clostridium acetireducens DSM 10703]
MYKILTKKQLAPKIYMMDIEAPRVAKSALPGQFIILRIDEKGERIPLTVCDYDREAGTITIVFQVIGGSTMELAKYEAGDAIADFVGPLGQPSELVHEEKESLKKKKIIFIAGGVGAAPVYPQVKWLHEHGVDADVIIGGKSKDFILFEDEMKKVAGNVYIATDDGSYGFNGMVTDCLKDLVENQGKKYDLVVAIGPMIMMKFVCKLTKELGLKTIVSLNMLMVDGTGMCGACRVTVGGETKFACVDGPEFDGHQVDFEEAMRRQAMYKTEEGKLFLEAQEKAEGHVCHVGLGGDK